MPHVLERAKARLARIAAFRQSLLRAACSGPLTRVQAKPRPFVAHMCYIGPIPATGAPMSTTTIRLPDALKARIAKAAEAAGTTSHNFILEAIAEKADRAEQRAEFHALANQRYAQFLDSGKSIPWDEARAWLKQRLDDKSARRPAARKQAG